VTPLPEISKAKGLAAGRVSLKKESLPHPEWIEAVSQPFIYLSSPTAANSMKHALIEKNGVQAVYTNQEITSGKAPIEVARDYYPGRCGDLWVVLKPKYIFSDLFRRNHARATHGR